MGEFGDTLRKEREARGVGLDAITRVTKISGRHLIALEKEQFNLLPGGVFNKGIVRGYARVVGLNEEEWIERYLAALRSSGSSSAEEEDSWIQFAENASRSRESSRDGNPDRRLRWAGVAILLSIVAVLSWFAWTLIHKKTSFIPQATGFYETSPSGASSDLGPDSR